jgi:threonine dehydrogenase-like Zn-dependent dehydrogenase
MGTDIALNPNECDIRQMILDLTDGKGVDISIEAVGVTNSCIQAVENLRIGGKSVWLGQGHKNVEINMLDIVTRELTIAGSFMYGLDEFMLAIDMLNTKKINVGPIITNEVPMSEAVDWFKKLKTERYG